MTTSVEGFGAGRPAADPGPGPVADSGTERVVQTTSPNAAPVRTGPYVLVGLDGSDPSCAALMFAVRQAAALNLRVVAVHAAEPPSVWPGYAYAMVADPMPPADMTGEVREQVGETLRRTGVEGLVDVETRVVHGHPAQVLLDQAGDAALIVVGRRGRGGFAAAVMGSTSRYVSAHAEVPVVVVPHD